MSGSPTDPLLAEHSRFNLLWLALVSLCLAAGLAFVAFADTESRGYGYTKSSYFFWIGICLIFVPTAIRLLMRQVDRRERLTLVVQKVILKLKPRIPVRREGLRNTVTTLNALNDRAVDRCVVATPQHSGKVGIT